MYQILIGVEVLVNLLVWMIRRHRRLTNKNRRALQDFPGLLFLSLQSNLLRSLRLSPRAVPQYRWYNLIRHRHLLM